MLDECAQAIYAFNCPDGKWDKEPDSVKAALQASARAVLTRLLDVSPEMRQVAIEALTNGTVKDPKVAAWDALVAYRAMLNAVLSEGTDNG